MAIPAASFAAEAPEAIVTAIHSALEGATTPHHGHMPEIEVSNDDDTIDLWAMEEVLPPLRLDREHARLLALLQRIRYAPQSSGSGD
jgi:hypothetical protein